MPINNIYTSVRAMSNASCEVGEPLDIWREQTGGKVFNVIYDGKVYQNRYWVERWHIPGRGTDPLVASPQNAWEYQRDATSDEITTIGNPWDAVVRPTTNKTPVIMADQKTTDTYSVIGFTPDGSGTNLSFTASRVCKSLYNQYDPDTSRPKLSAYITDWCQFDTRLDMETIEASEKYNFGRGFDLTTIPPMAYDKLIFSFMGVAGDTLFEGNKVQLAMDGWNSQVEADEKIKLGHIVPVDPYGDLGTSRNVGIDKGYPNCDFGTFLPYYNQQKAAGLLGGLRDLQAKAYSFGHRLELTFSIGGWSLSSYFSAMVRDPVQRAEFVRSVVDFFIRFPMFSGVDIDWEYPGGGGLYDNNSTSDYQVYDELNDGSNYALLITELRTALDKKFTGANRKEISIACSAVISKMKKSNLKELSDKGVDNIYLMSYDLFGTPWAKHIGHHTSLYSPEGTPENTEEDLSADMAINYLLGLGIPAKKINLGYANYGRACTGANLKDRTYSNTNAGALKSLGSFENGAPEFFDILNNYFDVEYQLAVGKNGFILMTDTVADADFLYSENSPGMHFISLDTPRTVKLKGEYANQYGLGGIFSWSGDQDCGLLANAAREGAGYLACKELIDMGPLYSPGELCELTPIKDLASINKDE
ncbi:glycosyl hydrolase family 18 protein [Enterobacter ludwigii]